MRDYYDEQAREDDAYLRRLADERFDRMLDHAPQEPCPVCHRPAVEVAPSTWLCACFGGYPE